MNESWPPSAPKIDKNFKDAHDAKENVSAEPKQEIVTKKEIEALEKLRQNSAPQLILIPPGAKSYSNVDQERLARIEKMKQRLLRKEGNARDHFLKEAAR